MKNITFRRFIEIVELLDEDGQINEGRIVDMLKRKLGIMPSDGDIRSEIERLKALNASDMQKIKSSAASKAFHRRKAIAANISRAHPAKKALSMIDYKSAPEMNAAQARAAELKWSKNQ